jgi:hypothetical protein
MSNTIITDIADVGSVTIHQNLIVKYDLPLFSSFGMSWLLVMKSRSM